MFNQPTQSHERLCTNVSSKICSVTTIYTNILQGGRFNQPNMDSIATKWHRITTKSLSSETQTVVFLFGFPQYLYECLSPFGQYNWLFSWSISCRQSQVPGQAALSAALPSKSRLPHSRSAGSSCAITCRLQVTCVFLGNGGPTLYKRRDNRSLGKASNQYVRCYLNGKRHSPVFACSRNLARSCTSPERIDFFGREISMNEISAIHTSTRQYKVTVFLAHSLDVLAVGRWITSVFASTSY